MKKLRRLELIENNLTDQDLIYLTELNNLESILLGNNNFININSFKILTKLMKLKQIDIKNNKFDYKTSDFFNIFPNLIILNNKYKNNKDAIYDEETDDNISIDENYDILN